MPKVIVIGNLTESTFSSDVPLSSDASLVASSMVNAIVRDAASNDSDASGRGIQDISLVDIPKLHELRSTVESLSEELIFCPLTLELPQWLPFAGHALYRSCKDENALRQLVQRWGYPTNQGNLWLPIVLTAKGPLYAEAIGVKSACDDSSHAPATYQQPVHLLDVQRQPLYELAQRLLKHLEAIPGVYLMQFGCSDRELWFDKLIPFPADPAIASIGCQTPDLFVCHWRCLTGQAIQDITVLA